MSLPLLEQVHACGFDSADALTWPGPPGAGEQYRFHFDMTKCIGCKCCEVACAEQNGNPVEISWRRVGEIEAGVFPETQRFYLSMGCNHCVDAACLKGCPVDAYTKDPKTGIVLHSADACIGCGYCTWNCPYSVPQMNPERGVVGKCDMCYDRLEDDRSPACVNACPEEAIQIEKVNVAEWMEAYQTLANSPGMPPAHHTISTTRITLPDDLIETGFRKADYFRVRPEHPHWALVAMLTLTQLSAGAFLFLAGSARILGTVALGVTMLALAASTLHLGRPIHAYRALKMWRRSWLSREVLLLTLFVHAAMATVAAMWLRPEWAGALSLATAALGFGGITAGAFIYLVPARPAWNTWHTPVGFYLTAASLGALLAGHSNVGAVAVAAQFANQGLLWWKLRRSAEFEELAASRLLDTDLRGWFIARLALLGIGFVLSGTPWVGFALVLASEFIGKYLFFVTVVPRNMALTYQIREAT